MFSVCWPQCGECVLPAPECGECSLPAGLSLPTPPLARVTVSPALLGGTVRTGLGGQMKRTCYCHCQHSHAGGQEERGGGQGRWSQWQLHLALIAITVKIKVRRGRGSQPNLYKKDKIKYIFVYFCSEYCFVVISWQFHVGTVIMNPL